MLRYRYLLLASAVVHVAMADDYDDYHSPNTCLTPGRCDSSTLRASDAATQAGIRVVQLLSGRDHAVPSTGPLPAHLATILTAYTSPPKPSSSSRWFPRQ